MKIFEKEIKKLTDYFISIIGAILVLIFFIVCPTIQKLRGGEEE